MPPRQPLSDLLRDLFDEHELRRLADGLAGAEELAASLPGSKTSRAELASELAASLERRDLIDARLFALLVQQRPRRAGVIVRVAGAGG